MKRATLSLPGALAALLLGSAAARAEPAKPPFAVVALDFGVLGRTTTWKDDLFGALRPASLPAGPIFGIDLEVYPARIFTKGRASWIGLAGRSDILLGVSTKRAGHDDALPTRAGSFFAAVRGRLPLSWGAAWIDAGVAGRTWQVAEAGVTVPDFPSLRFFGPRLGLGTSVQLPAGFSLRADAAAERWLYTDELNAADWFPHAQAWGVDAHVRASWAGRRGIGPYLDLAWSRDIAALRPQPGEPRIAGGYADDRLRASLGVQWTIAD